MPRLQELSEEEYLEIEDALASNARGRAFLRLRDQRARLVATSEVRRLTRELREEWRKRQGGGGGGDTAHVRILREELREMSAYIHQTRREIAALRPADAGANRIMAATGELDAIVSATERATSDILNGAERVQALAGKLPQDGEVGEIAREITSQITEILTACSFQDITGQRTTKVVNTLRYLEQRVNSMIEIWGVDGSVRPVDLPPEDNRPDAHLLNGPAADGGPSQDEVDALLARLDRETATAPAGRAEAPAPTAEPAPVPAPAPPPSSSGGGISSQAEIDALFN